MITTIIAIAVILLSLVFLASLNIRWGVFLHSMCKIDTVSKEVVLTFDDGPHPDYTPALLDLLKERGIKAIFFVIGEHAVRHPEMVKRAVAEGHTIGIHSYNHKIIFSFLSKEAVIDELQSTKTMLERITGKEISLFRPPFGVTNPNIAAAVKHLKLKSVGWNIRSLDTLEQPEAKILKRIESSLSEGGIILLHDRLPGCISLVKSILTMLDKNNYKVVGL